MPAAPTILAEQRGEGFGGAALDEQGLLLFGGRDPVRLSEAVAALPERACRGYPAVAALAAGGRYFVVRERSLTVYDGNLCEVQRLDLGRPVKCAALAGERLVVGGPEGLALFDPDRPEAGIVEFEGAAVEALSAPEFPAPNGSLLVRSGERWQLLGLPEQPEHGGRLLNLAEYDVQPWFEATAAFHNLLAFVVSDRVSLGSFVGRVRPW